LETRIQSYRDQSYPSKPGVYIMKDNNEKIIYIGKAKDLNKRIRSYFSSNNSRYDKTALLVSRINQIEYIITDNETEAFLLESNLIKKYRPLFNIELKDQQRYTYLKITDEKFPRLLVTRRNRNGEFMGPQGEIFGPFVKGSSRFLSAGLLRKMFKIRICKNLPKKECLEYHIGNCDAPCINKTTQQEYHKNIEAVKNVLKTGSNVDKFCSDLENEMRIASSNKDFEKAIRIRDTLYRLKNLQNHQKIENIYQNGTTEEYIGIIHETINNRAYIMTLISRNGIINDTKRYQFDLIADNTFENFIAQYYYSNPFIPNRIYLNEEIEDKERLEELLRKLSSKEVKIIMLGNNEETKCDKLEYSCNHTHGKDNQDKIKIMEMICNNLKLYVQKNYEPALEDLMLKLKLKKIPRIIDCFDISNFGNDYGVGACTRFKDGIPHKQGYRRFKIKKSKTQNDFIMMEEIIERRYKRINQDKPGSITEDTEKGISNGTGSQDEDSQIPDLIVIDGGKGHLSIALRALENMKLENIDCISIAKENEEIFTPTSNDPVIIGRREKSLKILQYIRDEAHRFGLAYNRKLRVKPASKDA
jgi:excinuclease ABC subunit C